MKNFLKNINWRSVFGLEVFDSIFQHENHFIITKEGKEFLDSQQKIHYEDQGIYYYEKK